MTVEQIIAVILRTPVLSGSIIELAALAARTGKADAVADVTGWWIRQGGSVRS